MERAQSLASNPLLASAGDLLVVIKRGASAAADPDALMSSAFDIKSLPMAKIAKLRKQAQVGLRRLRAGFLEPSIHPLHRCLVARRLRWTP